MRVSDDIKRYLSEAILPPIVISSESKRTTRPLPRRELQVEPKPYRSLTSGKHYSYFR